MIVFRKKSIIIVAVLLATVFTFILCISSLKGGQIGDADGNAIKIVLDAGHGGIDGGVVGVKTGVKESELNLIIVKKLETLFVAAGFQVTLTRSSDAGLYGVASASLKRKDMEKRRDIINKAAPQVVLSIHMNKFSLSSRRGAQIFYKDKDDSGLLLASCLQKSLNDMEETVKKSDCLTGDYYILNCTKYPSVIVECGFLSNAEDEALLITDEYQSSISYAIFKGVVSYLTESSAYIETFAP